MTTQLTGQLDVSRLVTVQGSLRLTAPVAAAWRGVADEVQRRYGWRPTLTDAYRDYASQVSIFLARYRRQSSGPGPFGDVRTWNGRRYVRVTGSPAAVPGTSNHGRGDTVDVSGLGSLNDFTTPRFRQFATVATRWGWSNAEGRSVGEPWHWVRVTDITPAPTATPAAQEDDVSAADVIDALTSPAGQKALADAITGPGSRYQVRNPLKPAEVWALPGAARVTLDYVLQIFSRVAALQTQVAALTTAQTTGQPIDLDALGAEMEAAAERALRDVLGSLA